MNASDVLIKEHRVIKRILECLTAATNQAKAGEKLDGDSFRRMVEFFQQFADRCHHGKEEARLFPLLRERGVGCGPGSISILLDEHEQGRAHVRVMADNLPAAEQGDNAALGRLCEHAEQYVRLLAEHIRKEDDCLFPTANAVLSASDQQALIAGFDEVERHEMGAGVHERLHALADELCALWGVPVPASGTGDSTCQHHH